MRSAEGRQKARVDAHEVSATGTGTPGIRLCCRMRERCPREQKTRMGPHNPCNHIPTPTDTTSPCGVRPSRACEPGQLDPFILLCRGRLSGAGCTVATILVFHRLHGVAALYHRVRSLQPATGPCTGPGQAPRTPTYALRRGGVAARGVWPVTLVTRVPITAEAALAASCIC